MDQSSERNGQGLNIKQVWTLTIEGGEPFRITKPSLHSHNGVRSLWQVTATRGEAILLSQAVRSFGCQVDLHTQERVPRNERPEGDYVYRSTNCGLCYFFDPDVVGDCGLEAWTPERVQVALETIKAKRDQDACPVRRTDADL